jgi:hypothetical protein
MPYVIQPEPGEKVLLDLSFRASEKQVVYRTAERPDDLRLGISDQAIYLPAKRFVVSGDPCYFRRVPREQVSLVQIQTPRPYALWIAAALMVLVGLMTEILMMMPLVMQIPGRYRVSGWPLAILVGGLLLPLAARGRLRLVMHLARGRFRWDPPLVMDRASKQRIAATLDDILTACRSAGIQVSDERQRAGESTSDDPETLADFPCRLPEDAGCEELGYVAGQAYEQKTGHEMPDYQFPPHRTEPQGKGWEEGEEEQLCPRLAARVESERARRP